MEFEICIIQFEKDKMLVEKDLTHFETYYSLDSYVPLSSVCSNKV